MITRGKAKLNGLRDLPGMTAGTATDTLAPPPHAEIDTEDYVDADLEPDAEIESAADAHFLPVTLDADTTPPKTNKTGNRRVLRLSQESREILKLLKQNLHLTYDQQIQFLGQLVLHHELLPESTGLQVQQRVRELRRFSHEPTTDNPDGVAREHLRLSRPLPLETLLTALE